LASITIFSEHYHIAYCSLTATKRLGIYHYYL
jgi:hypothetical protein